MNEDHSAQRSALTTGEGPNPARPAEEVIVSARRVACDGVGGALGHPRVYIELGGDARGECPYCDRIFVLAAPASVRLEIRLTAADREDPQRMTQIHDEIAAAIGGGPEE